MNRRRFLSFLGFGAIAGPAAAPTFVEAQPPSAINDTARAEMGRIAEWRDRAGRPCIFARAVTRRDLEDIRQIKDS